MKKRRSNMKTDKFSGNIIKSTIYNKKINSKMIIMSDIHEYSNNTKLSKRLVDVVKEQKPDIILIAGDIFNSGKAWEGGDKLLKFREFLSYLSLICPVCLTLGNHDLRGTNKKNKELRLRKFYDLKKLNVNRIYPLYNDSVVINNIEVLGYVPRFDLMEGAGLKKQIHGLAHDEFIADYEKDGIKFTSDKNTYKIYLGHAPHLIASSENGIGLKSLVADFYVTGHMHNGYKCVFDFFKKPNHKSLEFDNGWVEQPTGVLDKNGKLVSFPFLLGKSNLCRGIVYIDNDAQVKALDLYNKYYINKSKEVNKEEWEESSLDIVYDKITKENLHPMIISEGVTPKFKSIEKLVTINYIEFINK